MKHFVAKPIHEFNRSAAIAILEWKRQMHKCFQPGISCSIMWTSLCMHATWCWVLECKVQRNFCKLRTSRTCIEPPHALHCDNRSEIPCLEYTIVCGKWTHLAQIFVRYPPVKTRVMDCTQVRMQTLAANFCLPWRGLLYVHTASTLCSPLL